MAASDSYRPDIDGLRAIAVLSVIGFHTFPEQVRGGYVGVDLFFVISGYLITGVIVGGLERDGFTFAGFYARRVKRIFPALIVVLAACWVWGWFSLFADDYEQFGRHMAASAGFIPNFVLWRDVWYFDPVSERKPLLHLWSLGIEEQFYLVWPLLLYAAWKHRLNLLWATGLVLVASFLASVYEVRYDASAAFYSPFMRAWELALGATLACATRRGIWRQDQAPSYAHDLMSVAGLALVLSSVFSLGQSKVFLGLRMALPTTGAALLIGSGPYARVNRTLLSHPTLVWVGLISYPLYLWHWPLLSFANIAQSHTPTPETLVAAIAASVLLAWLTYRLVERPVRYGPTRTATVPLLCSLLAIVLCAGGITYWTNGLPERKLNLSDSARFIQYYERLQTHGLAEAYWDACDFMDWNTRRVKQAIDPECTRRGRRRTVLLWGDSYAQALSLGIRRVLPQDTRLAQIATSACPPDDMLVDDPEDVRCSRSNTRALSAIGDLKPDIVVLVQMARHESVNWERLSSHIRTLGAGQVVLVGPAPKWLPSLPLVITSQYWGRDYGRVKFGLDPAVFKVDTALKKRFEHASQLNYVSMLDRLCDADGCLATVPGGTQQDLIAVDAGHLSPKGSVFVVDRVLRASLVDR